MGVMCFIGYDKFKNHFSYKWTLRRQVDISDI